MTRSGQPFAGTKADGGMEQLKILSTEEKLAEIRRLYFSATRETIARDLQRALDLLKSMNSEEERERATVFMEGLNEMRSDWAGRRKRRRSKPSRRGGS